MPELELDTVFEAGELSTGDVIDSSSSASSNKNNNGGEIISSIKDTSNISKPHPLQNEVTTSNTAVSISDVKNINSNLLVVPNSIHLGNKVTTVIHEPPSQFVETPLKCQSNALIDQEKISKSETFSSSTITKSSYSECNEVMISNEEAIDHAKEDVIELKNRYI